MSDIKLFQFADQGAVEIPGAAIQVEKSLQTLFEGNLEALLGIRFIATEHSTGPVHGGRIDTLGLDEDNSPVIIEYKRAVTRTSSIRDCSISIGCSIIVRNFSGW